MGRSPTGTEDTSDTWSLTKISTRDLSHTDRMTLEKSISWALNKIRLWPRYDHVDDLKADILTQLDRIGFLMPKVAYRPSLARNHVRYEIRRRVLVDRVRVLGKPRMRSTFCISDSREVADFPIALLPVDEGSPMDLDRGSSPTMTNRRESISSDFAIYSPPPEDEQEPELGPGPVHSSFVPPPPPPPPPPEEAEPARSGITAPPPPPPSDPEPPQSEAVPLYPSNRPGRVSFNLSTRSTPSPAKRNPAPLSKRPDLVGSRSTSSVALLETRGEDEVEEEDVYVMCKRTLNRLFRNQADNCFMCPLCEQDRR